MKSKSRSVVRGLAREPNIRRASNKKPFDFYRANLSGKIMIRWKRFDDFTAISVYSLAFNATSVRYSWHKYVLATKYLSNDNDYIELFCCACSRWLNPRSDISSKTFPLKKKKKIRLVYCVLFLFFFLHSFRATIKGFRKVGGV